MSDQIISPELYHLLWQLLAIHEPIWFSTNLQNKKIKIQKIIYPTSIRILYTPKKTKINQNDSKFHFSTFRWYIKSIASVNLSSFRIQISGKWNYDDDWNDFGVSNMYQLNSINIFLEFNGFNFSTSTEYLSWCYGFHKWISFLMYTHIHWIIRSIDCETTSSNARYKCSG